MVGLHCYNYAESIRYDLNEIGVETGKLGDILKLIGFCHDFGKSTSFFQEYLFCQEPKVKNHLKSLEESKHGLISAVFAYFIVNEVVRERNGYVHPLLPLTAFEIVRRHHGNLEIVADEVRIKHSIDLLSRQMLSIDQEKLIDSYHGLIEQNLIEEFFSSYVKIIQDIRKSYKATKPFLTSYHGVLSAVFIQFCFSILISADKEEASGLLPVRSGDILSDDLIDRYRNLKGFTSSQHEMDEVRNAIYSEVVHSALHNSLDSRISSLNVPTGTGKTLTGLSYALKVRKRIFEQFGYLPRIIYSLPYISIIDQNSRVFEDVLLQDFPSGVTHDVFLKHHNLADVTFTRGEDEFQSDKGLFMIESWESEVVVTTFVQFFHTIISGKNRILRKYFRILNSIVILDEVQTIPHKYWLLLHNLIQVFSKHFFTYFVFMTATQPFIFESGSEMVELVPDKQKFFSALDRISLIPELDRISLSTFGEHLIEEISQNPKKDFLIVLNTIGSCRQLFKILHDADISGTKYVYLSTHVIPKERLERINAIKNDPQRKVIISTQLIEAGVDIDVDFVFRDFATLDSINQSSGRCNRHSNREKGIVKVVRLIDETNDRDYYSYIYSGDSMRTRLTMEVLKNRTVVSEPEFLEIIDSYYRLIKDAMSDDESLKILSFFSELKFDNFNEFQLIPDKYPQIDVFVCTDEYAHDLWERYQEIRAIPDRLNRKQKYLEIKKDFYQYVISVPRSNQDEVGYSDDSHIGYISKEEIEQGLYYNIVTGFTSSSKSHETGTLVL